MTPDERMPQRRTTRKRVPRPAGRVLAAGAAGLAALGIAVAFTLRGLCAPGEEPRPANRLAKETSPYLLQHAHNPVDWYPWGEEAFARATKEGRPVFLSIGYAACHWCHVMERESFEDEGIARLLNESFVSIKVDREERPDVDEAYMTAVQLLTERGGWPLSAFLTPEGKPFFGGTYFPREQFAELLREVASVWKTPEKRAQLEESANRLAAAVGQAAAAPERGTLSPAVLQTAVRAYMEQFDPHHGGFGLAPKFPPSMRLALMLREQRRKPDPKMLEQALTTLERMARGGIYDQVGGGFHRYSVDERWLVPHFEKMLYDNALLAWAYLDAADLTRKPALRRVAAETLDFVLREMTDPKGGGFYSTLDADSEGGEGRYYLWSPEQVNAVLGPADGGLFSEIFGITAQGNFEGKSIPNTLIRPVEEWARLKNSTPVALWSRLNAMRAKLLAARAKRPRPALDDKVLTSWNGLMIRSLALGHRVLGEERYLAAARRAATFLLGHLHKEGRLLRSYRAGQARVPGYLEDYSFLVAGLLELYEADRDLRWVREAQQLTDTMNRLFWDEASGSYFSTTAQHDLRLLPRGRGVEDTATPSGQSMAALALVSLTRLTGNQELRVRARRVMETYATPMKRYPAAFPNMLLAANLYFTRPATSQPAGSDPVAARLSGTPAAARPGGTVAVRLVLEVADGWHVNAREPSDANLIPTEISLLAGPLRLTDATFPTPRSVPVSFSPKPLLVYEKKVVIGLRLAVPAAARPGALTARVRVRYQPCSTQVCLAPAEKVATIPLRVVAAKAAPSQGQGTRSRVRGRRR